MRVLEACGADPRALAVLSGTKLHEYLGNLEKNPGAAHLLLEYAMEPRHASMDGVHDDDIAAGWLGIQLDEWEFVEQYTVRYGYTAEYHIYSHGDMELIVRHYRHDGRGRAAGTPETSVFLRRTG